jgi:hypothetical protein
MIPNGTDGNRDNKILVQTKRGQVVEQKKNINEHNVLDNFLESEVIVRLFVTFSKTKE